MRRSCARSSAPTGRRRRAEDAAARGRGRYPRPAVRISAALWRPSVAREWGGGGRVPGRLAAERQRRRAAGLPCRPALGLLALLSCSRRCLRASRAIGMTDRATITMVTGMM